ncbi:hypothetical protein [Nocardia sp. NPDC002869]
MAETPLIRSRGLCTVLPETSAYRTVAPKTLVARLDETGPG